MRVVKVELHVNEIKKATSLAHMSLNTRSSSATRLSSTFNGESVLVWQGDTGGDVSEEAV